MKIAIATDDWNRISSHVSKTKGFAIFDIENDKIISQEYRPRTLTNTARRLNDTKHERNEYSQIVDIVKDCEVVIAGGMEKKFHLDLKKIGIEVYISDEIYVKNVLELYLTGKLINKHETGYNQ